MTLTPRQTRQALRGLHIAVGVLAVVVTYLPLVPADVARLVLAAAVMPLLGLSGAGMATQARLRKALRSRRAGRQAAGR